MNEIEERIMQLEIDKAHARERCKEVWDTLQKLKSLEKKYAKIHSMWFSRHWKAEMELAKLDGRFKKIKESKDTSIRSMTAEELLNNLSKDQIERIVKELES